MFLIINSLGPRNLTALTKRNEKMYQSSRSMANTILFRKVILVSLVNIIYLMHLAAVNNPGRVIEAKCNPMPI